MEIRIKPFNPCGEINPPSSKSYCHRYLIGAFIANKRFTINNFNFCDDTNATLKGLEELGGNLECTNNSVIFKNRLIKEGKIVIDAKQSASTLRMLLPIACYLYDDVTFLGEESLFNRPLEVYEDILNSYKIPYEKTSNSIHIFKKLRANKFQIKGNISSQFVTGLLFYSQLSEEDVVLDLTTPLVSSGYVTITMDVLNEFGGLGKNSFKCGTNKKLAKEVFVETDYSSISYFAVLAALKGGIKINNINLNSEQPDVRIFSLLRNMGAKYDIEGESITFRPFELKSFDVNIENSIDLGPTLFVLGSLIRGTSIVRGVSRLIIKESNRLKAMIDELSLAGVDIQLLDDIVVIKGDTNYSGSCVFNTYNDHRIAMALAIFSVVSGIESTILNIECVNKSYPNFFNDLEALKQ